MVEKKPAKPKSYHRPLAFEKIVPWILVIGGVIGIVCAGILTYDHNKLAANPNYIPSCNLNPVIACGSVIKSTEAHTFDFPNPYIGLVAFPMLITAGVAMFAGAKFKRWYWLCVEAGTIFGLGFIAYLFYVSVYRIHALCPYCMVVWVVTITTFWYVSLFNIQHGFIKLPKSWSKFTAFIQRYHLDIVLFWFVIIAAAILQHFWYYYGKYL